MCDTKEMLVQRVINAWNVPGRNTQVHYRARVNLRKEWPTLYHALSALMGHVNGPKSQLTGKYEVAWEVIAKDKPYLMYTLRELYTDWEEAHEAISRFRSNYENTEAWKLYYSPPQIIMTRHREGQNG